MLLGEQFFKYDPHHIYCTVNVRKTNTLKRSAEISRGGGEKKKTSEWDITEH